MKRKVTDYALYRFRYLIGYAVLLVATGSLLAFAGLYVPGGIRGQEVEAIATSSSIAFTEFNPDSVINLPYHLLQRLSLKLFGVSILSIKLTSILLGVSAIIGLYLLMREWFRSNVAVITTLLAATTPIFLFMAQDGTPYIYAVAISTWLLYAATLVSRRRAPTILWKAIFFVLAALNFYTPLGIYLSIAIATTTIFHPHVRQTVKHFTSTRLITAGAGFAILLIPLLYSLAVKPVIGLTLLGIPATMPDLVQNILTVGSALFNFGGGSAEGMIHPMVSLGLTIIILLGIYRFFVIKYTARSYIVWLWAGMLLPLIILQPVYLPYLYPLIIILAAMGISSIVSTWYRTFPLNPYARVVGLIPLSVIVIGISMSGVNRYALSYTYHADIKKEFSHDIRIFTNIKRGIDEEKLNLIVSEPELELYGLYEQFDDTVLVSKTVPTKIDRPTVVSSAAKSKLTIPGEIDQIVTDGRKNNSDRFYVYTPLEK